MIRVIRIQESIDGQYFFTVISSNYNTLATSETYWNKADCLKAARIVQGGGGLLEEAA